MNRQQLHVIEILLVEDRAEEIDEILSSLYLSKIHCNLTIARNVVEALTILRREGEHADGIVPDLIMVALNLPKLHGLEVLAQIQQESGFEQIPTIVMTSSQAEEEIIKSNNVQADGFVTKPIDLEKFSAVVHSIDEFWFTVVKRPVNLS